MKCLLLLFLSLSLFSQTEKKLSIGAFGSINVYGVQAGIHLNQSLSLNLIGAKMTNYNRKNEYGSSILLSSTYFLPFDFNSIELGISLASVFSNYHWNKNGKSGDINDIAFRAGVSSLYRISENYQIGLSFLLINSFKSEFNTSGVQYISKRKWFLYPAINIDYLF